MPGRNNRKINELERKQNGQQMDMGASFPVSENGTTYQMTIQDLIDLVGEGSSGLSTTVKKFDTDFQVGQNTNVYVFLIDATNSDVKALLPLATQAPNKVFVFKRIDNTGNNVYIQGSSGNTIDGESLYSIPAQYASVTIASYNDNPAGWYIL